jgi:hypothetical protein
MEEIVNSEIVKKDMSNTELDSMIGKGIVRVFKYFVYCAIVALDMVLPVMFYAFVLMASVLCIGHLGGSEYIITEVSGDKEFYIRSAYLGMFGCIWLMFERTHVIETIIDYFDPHKN